MRTIPSINNRFGVGVGGRVGGGSLLKLPQNPSVLEMPNGKSTFPLKTEAFCMSYKIIERKASKACKIFMYQNKIVKMHTEKRKI